MIKKNKIFCQKNLTKVFNYPIYNSISDISEYSTGNLSSSYNLDNSSYLYKFGKIVFMFGYLKINATVYTNTALMEVPQGFRPYRQVQMTAHLFGGSEDSVNNFFYLGTSGLLKQNWSESVNIKNVAIIGSWYTKE